MHRITTKRDNNGAALIISMVTLLVLTLLGVASMRISTDEERMAGNLRDQNLAFQTAEAALKEAQRLGIERPDLFLPADQAQGAGIFIRTMLDGELVTEANSTLTSSPLMPNADDDASWADNTFTLGGSLVGMENMAGGNSRFRIEQQPYFDQRPGANGEARDNDPASNNASYRVQARSRGGTGAADIILEAQVQR